MDGTPVRTIWPPGGGETGARLRSPEGAATPLGPPQDWPAALRVALGMVLDAGAPMAIAWGPQLLLFPNDAALAALGPQTPAMLGRPVARAWPQLEAAMRDVLQRGETVSLQDLAPSPQDEGPDPGPRRRCGACLSPLRDEAGHIAGVFVSLAPAGPGPAAGHRSDAEGRYRAFVHGSPVSVFRATADGSRLLENYGGALPAHVADNRPIAESVRAYAHPEDRARVLRAWTSAVESGGPYEIEHRAPRPGGGWGWVHAHAVPVRDEEGRVLEWIGSAIDITARKQAEEALRRSEGFHRIAVEAGGIGTWDMDFHTLECAVSPAMARLMGLPAHAGTVSAAVWREVVAPEYRDALGTTMRLAAERDVPFELEFRLRLPGGGERWLFSRGRVTRDAAGRPLRVQGASIDVTERKQWEQRLRESEAQFRAIFETTSVGMAQADPASGRLLRVNGQLARMLGCTRAELLGRHFLEITHPDDREINRAGFEQMVRGELPYYEQEKRMLRKDGTSVWVMMSVSLIQGSDGTPRRTAAVLLDIDARKAAEEALRRTHDELETRVRERTAELAQANAALRGEVAERRAAEQRVRTLIRQLLGAEEEERRRIARELHDTLGQHLTVLDLGLKAVTELDGCSPEVGRQLVRVRQAARALDEAVDRLAHELRPPSLDDLGLEDALRQHAEAWSAESGIPVEIHTHGLRLRRATPVVETTVYRVVQEALTNVRRHAGAGRVALVVEHRGEELRALVEDDGLGFDTEALPQRAGRRRLGLRGMQERAALVGGRLEVESTPGFGTTVYLAIPLPDRDAAPPQEEPDRG